jgi:hypothetical protein
MLRGAPPPAAIASPLIAIDFGEAREDDDAGDLGRVDEMPDGIGLGHALLDDAGRDALRLRLARPRR